MHRSIFSYNLTRHYPFWWYTPAVLVGGIISIVLVSFINVPNAGYELKPITSIDPNATVSAAPWFGGWSSFFVGNSRSSCADATIPLNTKLYTNSSGLAYTLTNVVRQQPGGRTEHLAALVYRNNVLQNCTVNYVRLAIQGRFERSAGQSAASWVGVEAKAFTRCALEIDTAPEPYQPTLVDLVGTYNLVGSYEVPDGAAQSFLARNKTALGSLYWGQSLLSLYWPVVARAYYDAAAQFNTSTEFVNNDFRADLDFQRRRAGPAPLTADEVASPDFFTIGCNMPASFCGNNSVAALRDGPGPWRPYPSIWNRADVLARAMYFTTLVDLGSGSSSGGSGGSGGSGANSLVDPKLLERLTSNVTAEARAWQQLRDDDLAGKLDAKIHVPLDANLAAASFNASDAGSWSLGIAPAILTATYLCQVPQPKPAGILFLSVLIADLVLLQAIWQVWTLLVDGLVVRRRPERLYCYGCKGIMEMDHLHFQQQQREDAKMDLGSEDGEMVRPATTVMGGDVPLEHLRATPSADGLLARGGRSSEYAMIVDEQMEMAPLSTGVDKSLR